MENMSHTLFVLGSAGAALIAGYVLHHLINAKRLGDAKEFARRIEEEARKEGQAQKKEIILQGKHEFLDYKRQAEQELKELERELKGKERKLEEHGDKLEEKLENAVNIIKEFDVSVKRAMEITNLSSDYQEKLINELERQNIKCRIE